MDKIKTLQKNTKVSTEELAVVIGLSKVGLEKIFRLKSCKVSTLEKLANYFKVPVSYFFDEPQLKTLVAEETLNVAYEPCPNCAAMQAKIDKLNDDLIASQKETIAALKGEVKKEIPPTNSKKVG